MANPFNCNLPENLNRSPAGRDLYEPQERTNVQRRIDLLRQRLEATARAVPQGAAEVYKKNQDRVYDIWNTVSELADAVKLNPGSGTRSLQHMLARDFAVWTKYLGLSDVPSVSGDVRQHLVRARRLFQGGVAEAVAKLELVDHAHKAYRHIDPIRTKYDIPRNEWNEITTLAEEIGWHPYLADAHNLSEAGAMALAKEQESFVRRLARHGLTQQETDDILAAGAGMAQKYNEALVVANRAGLSIEEVENIGYFPRQFTEQAKQRLSWAKADEFGQWLPGDGSTETIEEAFFKARNTSHWVVEDDVVLDFVLRRHDPDIYNKLSNKYGLELTQPADLYDDRRIIGDALYNYLGRETLDQLADSGILSKIPMNSVELSKYLAKRYELPYEDISKILVTDWRTGSRLYAQRLEQLVGDSAYSWRLVRAAIEEGWGITARQAAEAPETYKGWRRLSEVIPDNLKERLGIQGRGAQIPGVLNYDTLDNTLVHPIAADMYRSMLTIGTSPNQMGTVGRIMDTFSRTFKSTVLSTSGTIFRILFSNIVQVSAAGGSLLEILPTMAQLTSGLKVGMAQALDDTRKVYRGFGGELVSELELFKQARARRFLSELSPISGESLPTNATFNWSAIDIRATAKRYGMLSSQTAEEFTSIMGGAANQYSFYFMLANAHMDNVFKFAYLKSTLREGGSVWGAANDVARFLGSLGTSRTHRNLEEGVEHLSNYFFWYDDLGTVDKMLNRHVVPFWTYMSRNPLTQFKHVMRNPRHFMHYQRLYQLMNAPVAAEGEDFPEGGVPNWIQTQPWVGWVIPEEDSASGEREYFAIPTGNIDPMADGWNFIDRTGSGLYNRVATLLGLPELSVVQNTEQQLDEATPWEDTQTSEWFRGLANKLNPQWKAAFQTVELLTQGETVDLFSGRTIRTDPTGQRTTSFLGVEVHPLTRIWMETLVPPLGQLNRNNPGGVFGRREKVDSQTGEVTVESRPSIFGVERSDYDSGYGDAASAYAPANTARNLGITVVSLDMAYNMGYTESQISFAIKDGLNVVRKLRRDNPNPDPETQATISKYSEAIVQLRLDHAKVKAWREERGYSTRELIRYLQRTGQTINDLPLDEETGRRIIRRTEHELMTIEEQRTINE